MERISWDKDEARRILGETAMVIDRATSLARETLGKHDGDLTQAKEAIDDLARIVGQLTEAEVTASRSGPWIRRSQARELVRLSRQLKEIFDVGHLVKMALDLTSQARSFIDMMNKVERFWGQDDYEEGEWERYLTPEQMLMILEWVENAKRGGGRVTNEELLEKMSEMKSFYTEYFAIMAELREAARRETTDDARTTPLLDACET